MFTHAIRRNLFVGLQGALPEGQGGRAFGPAVKAVEGRRVLDSPAWLYAVSHAIARSIVPIRGSLKPPRLGLPFS